MRRRAFLYPTVGLGMLKIGRAQKEIDSHQPNGDQGPFKLFLDASTADRAILAKILKGPTKPTKAELQTCSESFRKTADKYFLRTAQEGDIHSQYHLARCLCWLEDFNDLPHEESNKWLQRAATAKHPGALHEIIKLAPGDDNVKLYREAVLRGSVAALADICNRTELRGNGRVSWLDVGPASAAEIFFKTPEEAVLHWMVIYFYLLRVEPTRKEIKMKMPDEQTLTQILGGVTDTPKSVTKITQVIDSAADLAGQIPLFPLEEIYDNYWEKIVFGKGRWDPVE